MQHAGIGNSSIRKKAAEVAKHGRNGDTILAHISPEESALLSMAGKTKNPKTGLDEHFSFVPLLIGAAVGAITNRKNPLQGALLGAATAGIGQGISGAIGSAFPETAASLGLGGTEVAGALGAPQAAGTVIARPENFAAAALPADGTLPWLNTPVAESGIASGGIGEGIIDYFKSPSGILTGIGAAGHLLTPSVETPSVGNVDDEDEDYAPTDFTQRNSVFADSDYDPNAQGRSGYYYANGGGVGRHKYMNGGDVDEDVPYVKATSIGAAGAAARELPTASDVHSYGTRGEFNFFPNRVTADSPAAKPDLGAWEDARVASVNRNILHTSDGRVLDLGKKGNQLARYIPVGTSFADTIKPDLNKKYGKQYGLTDESTYYDLLKGFAPSYFAKGGATAGIGGGKDDKIPAMLSDGEHVLTADEVSDLGDGSNAEGQRRVYKMREAIRKHKNKGGSGHRPKAKKPSQYMKEAGV